LGTPGEFHHPVEISYLHRPLSTSLPSAHPNPDPIPNRRGRGRKLDYAPYPYANPISYPYHLIGWWNSPGVPIVVILLAFAVHRTIISFHLWLKQKF